MFRLLATSLLCLCAPVEAASARQPDDAEEAVCLAIGHPWTALNSETRRIETEPVPPRFRRTMDAGGCARFQLVKQDLITWHVRFGSERSTSAALAYLEQELTRDAPAPREYLAALQRAWRATLPDLRRAAATPQPEGASYSAPHRIMDRSRSFGRFRELLYTRGVYLDIAREYLRAGEEYGSLPLLARADAVLLAAEEGARFLRPLEAQAPARGLLHFNLDSVLEQDFRMRIAVARATATRSPSDLGQAQSLVAAAERPFFRHLAERSYSGGDELCEISEGWSGAAELEAACRGEEDIQERLTSYWINRAMLDLASDRTDADSVDLALRLLEQEQRSGGSRCCRYCADEDVFRLRLARADAAARALVTRAGGRDANRADLWNQALGELRHAERLTPPHEAPRRFRRIAEAWLELWQSGGTFAPGDREVEDVWPAHARHAAYLRHTLGSLEQITVGEVSTR